MTDKKALAQFFDIQKQTYDRCIYLDMKCQNDPIRAHSIQNKKVLELLHTDNHVLVPKFKLNGDELPTVEFKSVGRNSASTFSGLCAEHDNELFKLADTLPLDTTNTDQLNEYAYRAVMRELYVLLEGGGKFFALEADNVEKGVTKPNTQNAAGMMAIEYSERARRVALYRAKNFDLPMAKGEPPAVEHYIIELNEQASTIAVSSMFSVGREKKGDLIGVMLTVAPVSATKTTCIVSYAKTHRKAVKKAIPQLFNEDIDMKKAVSDAILQRVENFVVAPSVHDAWSDEKKAAVTKFFNECLLEVKKPPKGVDLSLF